MDSRNLLLERMDKLSDGSNEGHSNSVISSINISSSSSDNSLKNNDCSNENNLATMRPKNGDDECLNLFVYGSLMSSKVFLKVIGKDHDSSVNQMKTAILHVCICSRLSK